MLHNVLSCIVATSFAALAFGPSGFAPQGSTQPPAPAFHADVDYVRLDVVPTRNGFAVPNLQQDDFEVFENGVLQKIEKFEPVVVRSSLGPQRDLLTEATEPLGCISDGTHFIINAHDSTGPSRRVAADVSSHYLLGYYSTEQLDNRFHKIRVHVKRPGVQVHVTSGYVAAPAVGAAARHKISADSSSVSDKSAVELAFASLSLLAQERPMRLQIAAGWKRDRSGTISVVTEFAVSQDWKDGGEADILLLDPHGSTVGATHARIDPAARSLRVSLLPVEALTPGDYAVQVRARNVVSTAFSEIAQFTLPPVPDSTGAILFRRGPSTENEDVPTADARFQRSEKLRAEVVWLSERPGAARLLDRGGNPVDVPVSSDIRADADGTRWQTAQITLAQLAVGDYVLEIMDNSASHHFVSFRIVP